MTVSLAQKIESLKDREAFLKAMGIRTKPAPPPPRPSSTLEETTESAPATGGNPAPGPRPLTPEDIARAVQLLAGRVGPIAHVLVKRAARPGCSREEFIAALAAYLADDAERAAFLRALV